MGRLQSSGIQHCRQIDCNPLVFNLSVDNAVYQKIAISLVFNIVVPDWLQSIWYSTVVVQIVLQSCGIYNDV